MEEVEKSQRSKAVAVELPLSPIKMAGKQMDLFGKPAKL
eukprot:gene6496-2254_t